MEPTTFLKHDPAGFTIVEMIVVLAIIGFITVVAVNGQAGFNKSLTVTNTAYTIALTVRQAQTYGLSSRAYSGTSNAGYGTHFSAATPNTYLMYADVSKVDYAPDTTYCPLGTTGLPDAKPGNCRYDPSGSETVQNYTLGRGFVISKMCGHDTTGALRCSDDSTPVTAIDILFIRPNTNSVITATVAGAGIQLKDAILTLTAPVGGGLRYICVSQAGQVSVSQTLCP